MGRVLARTGRRAGGTHRILNSSALEELWLALACKSSPSLASSLAASARRPPLPSLWEHLRGVTWPQFWSLFPYQLRLQSVCLDDESVDALGILLREPAAKQRFQRCFEALAAQGGGAEAALGGVAPASSGSQPPTAGSTPGARVTAAGGSAAAGGSGAAATAAPSAAPTRSAASPQQGAQGRRRSRAEYEGGGAREGGSPAQQSRSNREPGVAPPASMAGQEAQQAGDEPAAGCPCRLVHEALTELDEDLVTVVLGLVPHSPGLVEQQPEVKRKLHELAQRSPGLEQAAAFVARRVKELTPHLVTLTAGSGYSRSPLAAAAALQLAEGRQLAYVDLKGVFLDEDVGDAFISVLGGEVGPAAAAAAPGEAVPGSDGVGGGEDAADWGGSGISGGPGEQGAGEVAAAVAGGVEGQAAASPVHAVAGGAQEASLPSLAQPQLSLGPVTPVPPLLEGEQQQPGQQQQQLGGQQLHPQLQPQPPPQQLLLAPGEQGSRSSLAGRGVSASGSAGSGGSERTAAPPGSDDSGDGGGGAGDVALRPAPPLLTDSSASEDEPERWSADDDPAGEDEDEEGQEEDDDDEEEEEDAVEELDGHMKLLGSCLGADRRLLLVVDGADLALAHRGGGYLKHLLLRALWLLPGAVLMVVSGGSWDATEVVCGMVVRLHQLGAQRPYPLPDATATITCYGMRL